MMKLSRTQRSVLVILAHEQEAYGSDFVEAGVLLHGSCYVQLAKMENLGLIAGREVPGEDLPRRIYAITDRGRAALVADPVVPAARARVPWWRRIFARWR